MWLEKVIAEEQTHRSSSRMSKTLSGMQLRAGDADIDDYLDCLEQGMRSSFTAATTDADHLKMFEQQRPFMYIETPLERFLTPGSSDPSYFSRPTLANMGFRYEAKERTDLVCGHVKATDEKALHAPDPSSR